MNKTELAKRIFEISAPWDAADECIEDIERQIEEDPKAVINYLLDTIDTLQP